MTNLANIDCTLPKLNASMDAVSYSGMCAIFKDGVLVGNGALLWTGRHIITAARVVDGTPSSSLTFKFNTSLLYDAPVVDSITIHPDYNHTTKFYENNLAVITLTAEVASTISRYLPRLTTDVLMKRFSRCVYGRTMNPATGEYATI